MVATIDMLPEAPSRRTQSRAEFVTIADNYFLALQPFGLQINAVAAEINATSLAVQASVVAATDLVARAEGAATFKVSFAAESWAVLSAMVGAYDGQSAAIFTGAGTHTDPVVGGTVDNKGIYRWSESPAGWKWIATGVGSTVAWADVTGKPSTFAPTAHGHDIASITGLEAALTAKAVAGAIGSSGLTMATARLLGRTTTGTGAVESITIGSGLSLADGILSYSGGSSMVYPAAGIAVSGGSSWGGSLAIPGGALVGTTAAQTLTNKTLAEGTTITSGNISGVVLISGEIRAGVTVSDTGTISANSPGMRGLVSRSGTNLTLVAADMGKKLKASASFTIVAADLPTDFSCVLYNNSNSPIPINMSTGTLRLGGTTTTGSPRYLAPRGYCTVNKEGSSEVNVSGAVT